MTSIQKMFHVCLVALMWIVSTAMIAAILVPSRISSVKDAAYLEVIMHMQKQTEMHYFGAIALVTLIWIVMLLAVSVPAVLKGSTPMTGAGSRK